MATNRTSAESHCRAQATTLLPPSAPVRPAIFERLAQSGGESLAIPLRLAHMGMIFQRLEANKKPFGVAAQIAHVNEYASKIILPYRPRAVVLYAGENDLSWPWSKSPEQVLADFRQFVEIIQSKLPETWIYYISIKSSPLRWSNWEKLNRTTVLIASYCEAQPQVQYIDVDAAMLEVQANREPIVRCSRAGF